MEIFFNLSKIRNKERKTQMQLAKLSGISQSHISELELEKESPTLKTIEKISNALKIHPYELIIVEEKNIEYYL